MFLTNFLGTFPGIYTLSGVSQGRTGTATDGLFRFGYDMNDLFKVVPNNVFLIKFSYWFSL
jgi:hypothetical protein